jgi:hypothetical protein
MNLKKRIVIWVPIIFLIPFLISCGSDPTPRSPQRAIPSFLSINLDQGGYGFTLRNSDSTDHRVVVEYLTTKGYVGSDDYTVKSNDLYHSQRRFNDGSLVQFKWVHIIDWI